jgi:hypothetical protein
VRALSQSLIAQIVFKVDLSSSVIKPIDSPGLSKIAPPIFANYAAKLQYTGELSNVESGLPEGVNTPLGQDTGKDLQKRPPLFDH